MKSKQVVSQIVFMLLLVLIFSIIYSVPVFAEGNTGGNNDLFNIVKGQTFKGRNDLIAKYAQGFIFLVQLIISLAGFIVLAMKTISIAFSLAYLSNPKFFDDIHQRKMNSKSQNMASGGGLLDRIRNGSNGDGIVMPILSMIMPDIKQLSDFGDGANGEQSIYYQDGMPTIGTYLRENIINFALIATLSAMLFSGMILRIIANIGQGGLVLGEKLETMNVEAKTKLALETGKDYQFIFPKDVKGDNKSELANKLYSNIKSLVPDNRSETFLQAVGGKIYPYVNNDALIPEAAIKAGFANPTLEFDITFTKQAVAQNTTPTQDSTTGVKSIVLVKKVSELVAGSGYTLTSAQDGYYVIRITAYDYF